MAAANTKGQSFTTVEKLKVIQFAKQHRNHMVQWEIGIAESNICAWITEKRNNRLAIFTVHGQADSDGTFKPTSHATPNHASPMSSSDYKENWAVLSVCNQAAKSPELSSSSCSKHGWESNIIWNAIKLNCQHNYQETVMSRPTGNEKNGLAVVSGRHGSKLKLLVIFKCKTMPKSQNTKSWHCSFCPTKGLDGHQEVCLCLIPLKHTRRRRWSICWNQGTQTWE